MHVKDSLVYHKHDGKMVRFVDLGEVNNHLLMFEQAVHGRGLYSSDVANSILVFMVKKLFHPFHFVYAQFLCASITDDLLFWKSVFRLENIGFKVFTCSHTSLSLNFT